MFLIISGGIGFIVWKDIMDCFKNYFTSKKSIKKSIKKQVTACSITCCMCFVFKCLRPFNRQKKSDPTFPVLRSVLPEALIDRFTSDVPFCTDKITHTAYRLIKFGLLTQSIMWFPTFGFWPACPSGLNSIYWVVTLFKLT